MLMLPSFHHRDKWVLVLLREITPVPVLLLVASDMMMW
jgi:hypothetical protein